MKLTFTKIHRESIFNDDFNHLTAENGTIEFRKKSGAGGIAVVYAPNGTGKSSFTEVVKATETCEGIDFAAVDEHGNAIVPAKKAFHIVADQISRHVIEGDESQYLVGAEIKREYELKKRISDGFDKAFKSDLPSLFKSKYAVTKVGDYLLSQVNLLSRDAFGMIRSIVNTKSRGKDIDHGSFISFIRTPENRISPSALDEEKTRFVIADCAKAKVVQRLLEMDPASIILSAEASLIEQHTDAISILEKYKHLHNCVVCDNESFDGEQLLNRKKDSKKHIYDSLDPNTKTLLQNVAMDLSLINNDPFDIKQTVMAFIVSGEADDVVRVQGELENYLTNIAAAMIFDLVSCFDGTQMFQDCDDLAQLQADQPVPDDEDMLYIQDVISENIDRDIRVIRDEDNEKNFRLMLGDEPLLNTERENMHLSTGEQNFISLAFELMLAKNSPEQYVVLDDPISSFDSVYKNKIAFCIVKFLESKRQIVLTHNLELVRLLEFQMRGCYNLYMLNNMDGARNGFIRVNDAEQKILINLSDLLNLFQNKDGILSSIINDRRLFLISMIPFMRGYAHISLDQEDYYGRLSEVMHGYGTASVDLVPIYKTLFGYDFGGEEVVTAADIHALDCENLDIIDRERYPLLADTLEQSLIYYYLRMTVEKKLIEVFNIPVQPNRILMLNDIIQKAFRDIPGDPESVRKQKRAHRVFFASRKTLLNEFNHFEGNINIFQPAIDITASRLRKEIEDIKKRLLVIERQYGD